MSLSTFFRSPLAQEVSQLATKLQSDIDVQRSLSKLHQLDVPLAMLRGFRIQELATRFIMDKDAKIEARALIAKIRRMEKGIITAPTITTTTIIPGPCLKRVNIATEEIMITSKRTAPVMIAPKPKKVSAQQDVHKPVIMEQSEKISEQLSKLEEIKKKLIEKKENVRTQKRNNVLIEIQQISKPEPPQKKRCYRRF